MPPEPEPKPGLLTSIGDLAGAIFDQPPEQRMEKERQAIDRSVSGKAPPKSDVPPPPPPVPGVKSDEKHEDDLVIEGMKIEQPAEIKSEQGRKSWKMYKEMVSKKITDYEKRIKDMESKVSTAPAAEAVSKYEARITEMQKERDDLNDRLGRASIERTPEFERHYVKRTTQVIDDVKAAVGKDHAERVEAILAMPDGSIRNGQLNDIMADMDEVQKHELSLAVKDLRQINREKKEQVDNWKEGLTKRENILAEQQERGLKEYTNIFDTVHAEVAKAQPLFGAKDGDDAWTNRAKQMTEIARELYLGKGTPQERARASMYGAFSGVLLETLKVQNEEMGKLTEQLKALRGKQPVVDGAGDSAANVVLPGGKAESMAERISRLAKEQGHVK